MGRIILAKLQADRFSHMRMGLENSKIWQRNIQKKLNLRISS